MTSALIPTFHLIGWLAQYIGFDAGDPHECHDCHRCGAALSHAGWRKHRLACAEIGGAG